MRNIKRAAAAVFTGSALSAALLFSSTAFAYAEPAEGQSTESQPAEAVASQPEPAMQADATSEPAATSTSNTATQPNTAAQPNVTTQPNTPAQPQPEPAANPTDAADSDSKPAASNPEPAKPAPAPRWIKSAAGWRLLSGDTPLTGFQKESGKTYYLDPSNGIMKTGWVLADGTWYFFTNSGAMKTGWLWRGGAWYYLNPSNGAMLTGRQVVKGVTYFLTSSGAMRTGWSLESGTWYYYTASGALKTGWIKLKGTWYYLDPAQDGAMSTGHYQVGKAWYASAASGAMYANGWVKLPEGWYYASGSGALRTGWLKSGSVWYWLQPDQGGLMAESGMREVDGVLYAFNGSGAMRANCLVHLEGDACGYAASSGAITRLGIYRESRVVLQDAEGNPLPAGWHKIGGRWFYADAEGVAQTGWIKDGKTWYYTNADGVMQTGWIQDGGKSYWLDSSGAWVKRPYYNPSRSSRLVAVARTYPYQGYGVCAKWVNEVYMTAGFGHPDGNANDLYRKYCNISDLSLIEPGMIIAVPSHAETALAREFGHVGIYMGNGIVRHNADGAVNEMSLTRWVARYGTLYPVKCGWAYPTIPTWQ